MNRIEELIQQLCPEGVEWKMLGEVGEFTRGKRFVKTDMISEGVPCIHYGEMYTHYKIWAKEAKSFLDPALAAKLRAAKPGDVIIVAAGETIEDIGQGVAWLGESDVVIHDACFAFSHSLHPTYVSYFLQTDIFHSQIKRHISSGKISSINAAGLSKAKIPIPPLPIQNEIVHILDLFTQLEAELEAELEARKTQYTYYRDALLNFEGKEVEWKTLGEVGEFKYGFTDIAKNQGNARFVRITDINENGKLRDNDAKFIDLSENNKEYLLQKGDILLARTGATYGKSMLFKESYDAVYASFLIRIRFKEKNILPSYYWHFAQSTLYWEQARKLVGGGAQPQFNANVLKLIKIPIPPLSEQQRIVTILDKFDALVNDLSSGLPAEIQARRQQYEYYRNQLLTFKNKAHG